MIRIPCPSCTDTFFSDKVDNLIGCPHCGLTFSWEALMNRRREARRKIEIPLEFDYQGKQYQAVTVDTSLRGFGIKVMDELSFNAEDILNFKVEDDLVASRVVWQKNLSGCAYAGLQRVN